jgi:hypothetical protein
MTDKKITQLTALTGANTVAGDQLAIVDVSDTTMSASGTTKKIALSELQAAPLSAGTANGVAYLNGSKVLTTGSALMFDGTNLGIGTSSPVSKLHVNTSSATVSYATVGNINNGLVVGVDTGGTGRIGSYAGVQNIDFGGAAASTWASRMLLDSSGNLGLGVTPSAWVFGGKLLQVTDSGGIAASGPNANYFANTFFNGSSYRYIQTGAASLYAHANSQHQWFNAPSGTAGAAITFTQAMTLDASGNLLVGKTSPTYSSAGRGLAELNGSTESILALQYGGANGYFLQTNSGAAYLWNSANTSLVIATNNVERARITNDGSLLVGTTSALISADNRLSVSGVRGGEFRSTGGATAPTSVFWNNATSGDNIFVSFRTETSDTQRGTISYNRAGGLTAYNTTSDYRAKDIIGPVVDSGALIDSTPVYMGKMKGATQERPMFIAHETPDYAHTGEKDAVDADGNPVYQQMDASALIPVMWAEIQSLRARLAAANI